MASTVKHLRSSTANKRPTASGLADGQLAINTASGTPGLFLKDNAGAVVKVGPVHVGAAAPNATPAGSSGNSKGELWVNDTTTIHGLNYYTGSAFVNLTPSGTTTAAGLVELATDAETQTGTDTVRAVTPSGLQSKVSDSTSTASSTTIASSTAVKAAFDLANAALPKSGGRVTGNLEIGPTGSLSFEGSTDDSFETFLEVVNPTADRTITFPNVTGTVVTTGDTGTVTSTMITDGTIVNADINASAGIVDTKLATISTAGKVSNSATTAVSTNTVNAIVTRDGSGNFSAGTITANLTGTASAIADNTVTSAKIVDGAIVNVDVNASAAIAGTKISPNFGSQTITTTGVISSALGTAAAPSIAFTGDTNTGIFSPGADQVAVATNGSERLRITSAGLVGIGTTSPDAKLTTVSTRAVDVLSLSSYFDVNGTAGDKNRFVLGCSSSSSRGIEIIAEKPGSNNAHNIIFSNSRGDFAPQEAARIDSSGRLLVGTSSDSGGALFQVNDDRIRIGTAKTPASASATGTTGEIAWDANYIYVCTATNTWKRVAIATW
jgi:trimeric autotransporter adhesin